MRYCGVVGAGPYLQLATLEEVRTEEPPIRLHARFYEPGSPAQVGEALGGLGDEAVVGIGAPLSAEPRLAGEELGKRGVSVPPVHDGILALIAAVNMPVYAGGPTEQVHEGAYVDTPVFETNADGVFCALRGIRLPAKRHPFGIQLRIEELLDEHVEDDGGELWHRRIEEVEAAAVALCAHRFAVGHACWVGDPAQGVIVLPGSRLPERFSGEGVVPPVSRVPLG